MRSVIYSMMVSLDGYVETPQREIDWVLVDEELHTFVNAQSREIGTILYGRRMYELMAAFWPTADAEPNAPPFVVDYARIWKETPKLVFSKRLERVAWNSRLVREDIVDVVAQLKREPGPDLGVGGATIAAALIQRGLIDEYRLFLHPVVLGGGTPYLPSLDHRSSLRLRDRRSFKSGVVYLSYKPTDRGA